MILQKKLLSANTPNNLGMVKYAAEQSSAISVAEGLKA